MSNNISIEELLSKSKSSVLLETIICLFDKTLLQNFEHKTIDKLVTVSRSKNGFNLIQKIIFTNCGYNCNSDYFKDTYISVKQNITVEEIAFHRERLTKHINTHISMVTTELLVLKVRGSIKTLYNNNLGIELILSLLKALKSSNKLKLEKLSYYLVDDIPLDILYSFKGNCLLNIIHYLLSFPNFVSKLFKYLKLKPKEMIKNIKKSNLFKLCSKRKRIGILNLLLSVLDSKNQKILLSNTCYISKCEEAKEKQRLNILSIILNYRSKTPSEFKKLRCNDFYDDSSLNDLAIVEEESKSTNTNDNYDEKITVSSQKIKVNQNSISKNSFNSVNNSKENYTSKSDEKLSQESPFAVFLSKINHNLVGNTVTTEKEALNNVYNNNYSVENSDLKNDNSFSTKKNSNLRLNNKQLTDICEIPKYKLQDNLSYKKLTEYNINYKKIDSNKKDDDKSAHNNIINNLFNLTACKNSNNVNSSYINSNLVDDKFRNYTFSSNFQNFQLYNTSIPYLYSIPISPHMNSVHISSNFNQLLYLYQNSYNQMGINNNPSIYTTFK